MIELIPLCTIKVNLEGGSWTDCGESPLGTRIVAVAGGLEVLGDRLSGAAAGPCGDWATVGADGLAMIDGRQTIVTHDGAHILITFGGRMERVTDRSCAVYTAPTFWTGDPRYLWLNAIQAVSKGTFDDDGKTLTYELCEVK